MTTTFRIEHDFPDIPVAVFERYLNSPELIANLAGKMPGLISRQLVDKKDLGSGSIGWRFKVTAGSDIPAAARKVLNEDFLTWHEDTRFVPAEHTIYWTVTPLVARAASLLESKGTWKLIAQGQGTRRVIEGATTVKVPFVGKVAEAFLVDSVKRSYSVEPEIQRAFYLKMMQQDGAGA